MQIKLGLDKFVGLHQDQDTCTPSCPGSGPPRCDCSWWRRSPQSAQGPRPPWLGCTSWPCSDPQLAKAVGASVVHAAIDVAESKLHVVCCIPSRTPSSCGRTTLRPRRLFWTRAGLRLWFMISLPSWQYP